MRWAVSSLQHPRAFTIVLIAITLLGLGLRVSLASESLFADELATYWVVAAHSFGGVLRTVHSDAEISPPLLFLLAKASRLLSDAPEALRLPSLVAGTLTIPLVGLIGARTVGRSAAMLAMVLTAFAPFTAYYSAEARGYALMVACVAASTLAMLKAVDTGHRRWWVAYATGTAAAAYSHYTCVFVLAAQIVWLWVFQPQSRRPAVVANAAALVAFLPWAGGFKADLYSPTGKLLAALSPLRPHDMAVNVVHWVIGYPYAAIPVTDVPGVFALALIGIGVLAGIVGLLTKARNSPTGGEQTPPKSRLLLVVVLALATPIGVLVQSAAFASIFSMRNLAASWPALALATAWLVLRAPSRVQPLTASLLVVGAVLGGLQLLKPTYGRPDYNAAAHFVNTHIRPGDAVVDVVVPLSPGPVSGLDVELRVPADVPVERAGAPAERDHPFTIADPLVTQRTAISRAVAATPHGRIFVVAANYTNTAGFGQRLAALQASGGVPPPYRLKATRSWATLTGGPFVQVWVRP